MNGFQKITLFLLSLLLLAACRKSTTANWDVDVVIPVVKSSLNIKNFLGDSLFKSDNNGLLHFKINREVASIELDSLFKLPDTTINYPFKTLFPLVLNPGQAFPLNVPSELNFSNSSGIQLKRVDIKRCTLTVTFSNDLKEPLNLKYRIPSATKAGNVFEINETVPTGQNVLIKNYDLSGYTLDMRGSGKTYNTILQTFTVNLSPNASSVQVNSGQGANMLLSYSEVLPQYVEGYFGQQQVELPSDTTSLGLSDNFKVSNFMLDEAVMSFSLVNEFGCEFSGGINSVKGINSYNADSRALSGTQLQNLNINRAIKSSGVEPPYLVQPSIKTFFYNKSNSNIPAFISLLPNKIVVGGKVSLNPLGNISGYNDFAFYNTGLRILADIDIPLRFSANYFRLRSLAKVDFSGIKALDNVNSGSFIVTATNGYPFNAQLQAYLLDGNNQVIDSLFISDANTIQRGQINDANEVVSVTKSSIRIPITASKIEHLKACKSIQFITSLLLPSAVAQFDLKEVYQLDLGIVAEINYNIGITSRN